MTATTQSVASTQASMVKTFQSSRKSFASSITGSISSLVGSIASGMRTIASLISFPVSLIRTMMSDSKEGEKAGKVKLRVKHPKLVQFWDWFVLHSPPGTAATTTADPEKNAADKAGAATNAQASGSSTAGETAGSNTAAVDEAKKAEEIKRGEEIMAERAAEQVKRHQLASDAATYFKEQTGKWRQSRTVMDEESKKVAEEREQLKYEDIFKPSPDPPILTGDDAEDAKMAILTNRIVALIQCATYYKEQLAIARQTPDALEGDPLKVRSNAEDTQFGYLFKEKTT